MMDVVGGCGPGNPSVPPVGWSATVAAGVQDGDRDGGVLRVVVPDPRARHGMRPVITPSTMVKGQLRPFFVSTSARTSSGRMSDFSP